MAPASQQKTLSAGTTENPPPSVFGNGEPKVTRSTAARQKRKTTDPNLQVLALATTPDATVIVGSVEHEAGQKAIRVNKSALQNVSPVWAKMFGGEWKESTMSEIAFPDDNCDAFLIVLQIAHFRLSDLPETLSRQALVELAILADKYELHGALRMRVEAKKWMDPYHRVGVAWPPVADINDFILITPAFGKPADLKYLANRVAMESYVDDADEFYLLDAKQNKISVRSDAPASQTLREIRGLRSDVLSAWTATCTVGFDEVAKSPLPPRKRSLCAASKIGVLLVSLQKVGFYPSPCSTEVMRRSIVSYWKDIKSIGASHKPYTPCTNTNGGSRYNYNHSSICSFEKCFGDFGIISDARTTLERHAHADLWKEWLSDGTVQKPVTPSMIRRPYESDSD